jgi:hypothetical protein
MTIIHFRSLPQVSPCGGLPILTETHPYIRRRVSRFPYQPAVGSPYDHHPFQKPAAGHVFN